MAMQRKPKDCGTSRVYLGSAGCGSDPWHL